MLRFSTKFGGFTYAALDAIGITRGPIQIQTRITRGYRYVEELLMDTPTALVERLRRFFDQVALSRYVGVTNMNVPEIGSIDVLVDTTGTERNANCLAVICRGEFGAKSQDFVQSFAKQFDCEPIR
jgi:hypothetical protein